jgi:3-deoxy-manno-octulosonate cytidylyltransferase (CMP-KDO synthetase)
LKLTGSDKSQVAVVIPARYESTRFPGKPLVKIAGTTMIERVYAQAAQARNVGMVVVATDDERIREAVTSFGGTCLMTRNDHSTGTDRLAEIAQARPDIEIIVNVQGDEPLIDPAAIEAVVEPLLASHKQSNPAQEDSVQMSTLAFPITDREEVLQPSLVKVVLDQAGFALYFSRYAIPFCRNAAEFEAIDYLGHMGIYAYTRHCLLKLAALPPTPLENAEKLEQLRALENGIRIKVLRWHSRTIGVDLPEDIAKVEKALTLSRV